MNKSLDRILDANLNRAREGLRVAEELARLGLEDAGLQSRIKTLRHRITAAEKKITSRSLILSRSAERDPGNRSRFKFEKQRGSAADLVQANLRRCQEALRVLEEISTVKKDGGAALRFKRLRFQVYDLERDFLKRLISLKKESPLV